MTTRLTPAEKDEILTLARDGVSRPDIAQQFGRSLSTISAVVARAGVTFRNATPPDTGPPDTSGHGDSRITLAEKMARIVQLRSKRWTFGRIGDELGHSRQWVHELYERALAEVPAADVHLHRVEMLDQLDEIEAVVLEVLHTKHVVVSNGHVVSEIVGHDDEGSPIYGEPLVDHGPVLDAARTLVALQGRRAKLVGADAPIEMKSNETVTLYQVALGDDNAAREALT